MGRMDGQTDGRTGVILNAWTRSGMYGRLDGQTDRVNT